MGLARSSAYAARPRPSAAPRSRPGPQTTTSDALLLERIREVLAAAPFSGEGHRKVWARLRRLHGPARRCAQAWARFPLILWTDAREG